MNRNNIYLEAVKGIPSDVKKETEYTFAVSDAIHRIMMKQELTQKELAKKMGKTETVVKGWLSGEHKFTLRTLAKLSVALGEDVIHFG